MEVKDYAVAGVELYSEVRSAVADRYCQMLGLARHEMDREDLITVGVMSAELWKRVLPPFRSTSPGTSPPGEGSARSAGESARTAEPTPTSGATASLTSAGSAGHGGSSRDDRRRW